MALVVAINRAYKNAKWIADFYVGKKLSSPRILRGEDNFFLRSILLYALFQYPNIVMPDQLTLWVCSTPFGICDENTLCC